MDTREFMVAANIQTQPMVSYYIKKGVIEPSKSGKSYVFSQTEVDRVIQYRAGELKVLSKPSKNLNHSIINSEPLSETSSNSEFIEGEKIKFTHNCWGEPFDDQTEPKSPATHNLKTLKMFFALWRGHENDSFFEHINSFCQRKFGVTVQQMKRFYSVARSKPDALAFDQYYMPAFKGVEPVYTYNDSCDRIKQLKREKPYRPDWPDIEVYTAAFLLEFHLGYNGLSVAGLLAARQKEDTDILMYELNAKYHTKEADTFPDTWHKTTRVYHGKNRPKCLTQLGLPKFPDQWEDMRYDRSKFKLETPALPDEQAISKMSGEEYGAAIMKRRLVEAFKQYYEIN